MVDAVNRALHRFPLTTSFTYLYHNGALATCCTVAGVALGAPVPVELGAAYVVNSAMRRARTPAVIALAAVVVRTAPSLATVRVSRLVTGPFASILGSRYERPAAALLSGTTPTSTLPRRAAALLRRLNPLDATSTVSTVMDRYGLAYVLTARAVSACSLLAIAGGLRHGVDLAALLTPLGVDGSGGTVDAASSE